MRSEGVIFRLLAMRLCSIRVREWDPKTDFDGVMYVDDFDSKLIDKDLKAAFGGRAPDLLTLVLIIASRGAA